MRALLVTLLILNLGATPRHRRFMQRNLPAGSSCTTYPEVTNYLLRSQAYNLAPWDHVETGAAAPVVTANAATAPDCALVSNAAGCGAATADEIAFPEVVGSGNYSFVYQLLTTPGTTSSDLWLKGKTTSGVIDFSVDSACVQCAVTTEWTRCAQTTGAIAAALLFGSQSNVNGCAAHDRVAFTVYVWNGDAQGSATITPPIPTAGTAVTRAAGCF